MLVNCKHDMKNEMVSNFQRQKYFQKKIRKKSEKIFPLSTGGRLTGDAVSLRFLDLRKKMNTKMTKSNLKASFQLVSFFYWR